MSKIKRISRHSVNNIELILESLDHTKQRLAKDFENVQKQTKNLGSFYRKMLEAASSSALAESLHDETINYMKIALLTGLGNLQSARYPGEPFNIYIGEQKLSFQGVETTAYIDTYQWELLYYLAVILRDTDSIKILNQIPESLMRKADIEGDEADYAVIRFYKGLFDSDANIGKLLLEAMESIRPSLHESEREEYILQIKGPELDLYTYFFSNEPEDYNRKLTKAVWDHKEYWGSDERDYDELGWISYPLTAACAIAHDNKQYDIEVDSPYVPLWLVKREF